MIASEARERLESLDSVISTARDQAGQLTGEELRRAAHDALYLAIHGDGSGRIPIHSETFLGIGAMMGYLSNPVSEDYLPLGHNLDAIVQRREVIREYILGILPGLNEAFSLGLVFDTGGSQVDG